MNRDVETALKQSDPFDLIWALETCFDVDRQDLANEPNPGRRVVVMAAMFASVFGASGYAGIINELRPHLQLVATTLDELRLVALAEEVHRIVALAKAKSLTAQSGEDEWSEFIEVNGDFRRETQRDVPSAAPSLAQALKSYIQSNPVFFEK
jgi:hypothetical protein